MPNSPSVSPVTFNLSKEVFLWRQRKAFPNTFHRFRQMYLHRFWQAVQAAIRRYRICTLSLLVLYIIASGNNTIIQIKSFSHPLESEFEIRQRPSNGGKNFPGLHRVIMNLKGWLRGIHHHCSGRFMNGYLDEFFFRFNRRNFLKSIWHKLIERFMTTKPYCYIANEV